MFSRPSAFRSFSLVALGAISLGLRAARAVVSLVAPPPVSPSQVFADALGRGHCGGFAAGLAEVEGDDPPAWVAAIASDVERERVSARGGRS